MKLRHLVAALMGLALALPTSAFGAAEPRGGGGGARGGGGGARGGAPARSGGVSRSAPARSAPARSAPSRTSASRASAPRASAPRASSAPRSQSPRFSSSSTRAQAPRRSAPRAQGPRFTTSRRDTPRVQAPRATTPRSSTLRNAFQDGQPAGGPRVAPAPRGPKSPTARGSDPTPAPAPRTGGRDAFRGQDVPRGGQREARNPGSGDRVGRGSDRVGGARETPRDLNARPGTTGLPGGRDRTGTGSKDGFVRRGGLEPGAGGTDGGATDGSGGRMGGRGKSPANWQEYRDGFRNGHRVAPADTKSSTSGHHHDGHHSGSHCGYHDYYDHHGWYLSFSFGFGCGPYYGFSYYWPYHSWNYGCDYAFFYPYRVAYAYVPYGFYVDTTPIYVTRYEYVTEVVPETYYETREVVDAEQAEQLDAGGAIPPEDGEVKVAEPRPAAGSPATEKFLREASEQFRTKQYYEAAVNFRLAALSSPDLSGPLFALGQSLVALGNDEYAAKVMRRAVLMDPLILQETGDISGVFESASEYESVMAALAARAAEAPVDGDARFLLAAERYFAGDPRCREEFDAFHVARPDDGAVELFRAHAGRRFKDATDLLPPVESPK